jgi:hypothetical protein
MPLDTRWIATLLVTVLLTSCAAENEGTGEDPLEPAATTADDAPSAAGDLDGGPSEDEPLTTPTVTGPTVTEAVHLDGRTLVVAASDQPFHFMTSVAAIAALGPAASSMLEELDYDANAEVWAGHVSRLVLTKTGSNSEATSVAAMGIIQSNTNGEFLTPAQVADVRQYLTLAADREGYTQTHVAAAGLAVAARHFRHEEDRLTDRSDLDFFRNAELLCAASEWVDQPWEVAAQLLTNGLSSCTPEQLSTSWSTLADHLNDLDPRVPTYASEAIGLLHIVHDAQPPTAQIDTARYELLRRTYLEGMTDDPWEWLWGYYKFELDLGVGDAQAELSPAARTVLTFFAARGTPEIRMAD